MPGGRRNAKSSSFKHHHAHVSDDRKAHDLPKQPQVVPPKHIPLPDVPPSSEFYFELDAFLLSVFAMTGQYINLYRNVFWLPHSYNDHYINYYLVDYYVLAINLIMVGRRLPVCLLKQVCSLCFPSSYQSMYTLCINILTVISLVPVLLYCFYNVIMEHGYLTIIFLIYPFVVYVVVLGTNITKFLELKVPVPERAPVTRTKGGGAISKSSSTVNHVCSMSAETIREEVETLRNDFNNRWEQVLFNSFLVVYHSSFLPCYFAQNALHFDVHSAIQHGVLTGFGCLILYLTHCFPSKYCDVLHRAALHLGRWQRIEIKNVHVPFSTWTESAMWNQGALVKHSKELFKAEGIANAAEPGNIRHSKFFFLFKNPAVAVQSIWLLQVLLILAEVIIIAKCSGHWNEYAPVQLQIMIPLKLIYRTTKVCFVTKRIYKEESELITRFSN